MEQPQYQELEKAASATRHVTRAIERENEILDNEGGLRVVHDLENSDIGQ